MRRVGVEEQTVRQEQNRDTFASEVRIEVWAESMVVASEAGQTVGQKVGVKERDC